MLTCPSCGQENPDGSRFCNACGAPLAEARPGREERKVVTCLFCDLVGFTSRAEALDPEDVRALLSGYHERVRRELERFGGTVEKFVGDAVMALFGAPTTHEDDPERAVRAAVAIRDWATDEEDLQVRIGITTGEALVSLDAHTERGEGMASGDVVNTAARLQAAAPENGILVDALTHRATERAIDYGEADSVAAKGKAAPVDAWQALEPRARIGIDVTRETWAPLVGREKELDVLLDALGRVRSEREPQLVTLVGVPGIGKSRLVTELLQAVHRDPDLVNWRQGRSLPYGEGVSFWALGEMVKAQAGILESDSAEEAEGKLHTAVAAAGVEDADWVEHHLRPLVGAAEDHEHADHRREEAFAAWRAFLEALAEARPTVLVFEDLHWADDGLLEFIDHVVDWATGVPLLVIATARPELLTRRSGWGGGKPNAVTISLPPLSEEETARLVHDVLARAVLPADVQQRVLERAAGNPLYAEEFARAVTQRGEGEAMPVPESIQGLIAARLDALSPDEKAVLQDAAVLGKVFWRGALAALDSADPERLEGLLHGLERKEFVRRERRSSVADEREYSFRHLLVRDVAYGQIPRARRAEKHARAAEWMERLGRPDDHAELVAHHYLEALEYAADTGTVPGEELRSAARHALREAGDRALALNAFPAAARFYGKAIELWPEDDPQRPYLLFRCGKAHQIAFGAAREQLVLARDGLLELGDRETAAEADVHLTASEGADYEEQQRHYQHALALVDQLPPSRAKAEVMSHFAYWSAAHGDDTWTRIGEDVLRMAEELGLEDIHARMLANLGNARFRAGDASAIDDVEQGRKLLLALNSPDVVTITINLAAEFQEDGWLERCFELQAEARRLSERFGRANDFRHLRSERVLEDYWRGRWDEASAEATAFLADAERGARSIMPEATCLLVRAQIRLARDDLEGALGDGERAIATARENPFWGTLSWTFSVHARTLLAHGKSQEAGELAGQALSEWAETPLRFFLFAAPDLAAVLSGLGRGEEFVAGSEASRQLGLWLDAATAFAAGDFGRAAEVYAEVGSAPDVAYARLRSGADGEVRKALDFYRSVRATRYVKDGESLLAATA